MYKSKKKTKNKDKMHGDYMYEYCMSERCGKRKTKNGENKADTNTNTTTNNEKKDLEIKPTKNMSV